MEKQKPTESTKAPEKKVPKKSALNTYARFSGLALQMLVTIGLSIAVGYLIDSKLDFTVPVFTLIFAFASLLSIIFWLIRLVNKEE